MAKSKKPTKPREMPKSPAPTSAAPASQSHALRETVESIVIAFVLAFLFRTFEAEAFVIPTGSMAPTLMGRHKDVDCPKCGYRYQVSASEENSDNPSGTPSDCIAGMCPICHYVLPMVPGPDLPVGVPEKQLRDIPKQRSYNGDRILVNKYVYTFSEPQRWDVVVFKFPGDAKINYIKRLVGLPGETLRIYQGDLFIGDEGASQDDDFKIARKPADKVLAMRQLVHDTDYDPAELDTAGWPLRWRTDGWQLEKSVDGNNVRQRYRVDSAGDEEAWLRYEHVVPDYSVWQRLAQLEKQSSNGKPAAFPEAEREQWRNRLITDANPYNAQIDRRHPAFQDRLEIDPLKQGVHWVGDLMVEADVELQGATGELLLDLVEGGRHFTCRVDLKSGEAKLAAEGVPAFASTAKTSLNAPGKYRVAFANFDDQLLLWIDGDLISFEGGAQYDVKQVFGDRRDIRPQSSDDDAGDLSPVGIGARNAKLTVTRLQVWRDIYYIADSSANNGTRFGRLISDFDPSTVEREFLESLPVEVVDAMRMGQRPTDESLARVPREVAAAFLKRENPISAFLAALPGATSLWDIFSIRRHEDFRLGPDQFFVMGDNSAESSDARLWSGEPQPGGKPGGQYLERRLLIGKALCVYWPHSWNRIPGTPIPFPLFPNVLDMRLVR